MQEEYEKYDTLLTTLKDNFSKMLEKLYTRENVSIVTEVKEIYLTQTNRPKTNNLTFELNQIFTNLEKLIVFVEKEKQGLLSKKESSTMEQEDIGVRPEPFTEKELETLAKLLKTRVTEQEEHIGEIKALVNNLNSLANINQL